MEWELKRASPEIGLESVATKRNLAELLRTRRLALTMGASFVVVTNVLPYSSEYKDDILYGLSTAYAPRALALVSETVLPPTRRARRHARTAHRADAARGLIDPL